MDEIILESSKKGVTRFISTHPDHDHICGLEYLDDKLNIRNFYCVKNEASKEDETDDFNRYSNLRDDSKKSFYIQKGCSRNWMNNYTNERGSSGINILWPDPTNIYFKNELIKVKGGESPNNISPIIEYNLENGVTAIWMGDLEKEFMENIKDNLVLPKVDILFAPHHGRGSGKIPKDLLDILDPKLVIIGEAPSEHLNYYEKYDKITQNSAGDIIFECLSGKVHVYVTNDGYTVDFLDNEGANSFKNYIGTLNL